MLRVLVLLVGFMIVSYAGNAPFQIQYTPNKSYYFTIYSLVDNLIIYDVKVNNGHTELQYDTKHLSFPIKLDNKLKRWADFGFDLDYKVITISVSTNKGDWTFSTVDTTKPFRLQYYSWNYLELTAYKDMTIKRIIYNGNCNGQIRMGSLPYQIYVGKTITILPDGQHKECDQIIRTVDIETDIGSWRYSL